MLKLAQNPKIENLGVDRQHLDMVVGLENISECMSMRDDRQGAGLECGRQRCSFGRN